MRDLLPALLLFVIFALLPGRLYAPLREASGSIGAHLHPTGVRVGPPAPAFPEAPVPPGQQKGALPHRAPDYPGLEPSADPPIDPRVKLHPSSARLFAGPGDLSPEDFGAYGVIAFNAPPQLPEDAVGPEAARLLSICAAFLATLAAPLEPREPFEEPPQRVVVTVWPMQSSASAERATRASPGAACPIALQRYRMPIAQVAIAAAVDSGLLNPFRRGPFLMAWQPGADFASPGKPILFDDLSDVTTPEEARARFAQWDRDIANEDSYARALLERMGHVAFARLRLRAWADLEGARILRAVKSGLNLGGDDA